MGRLGCGGGGEGGNIPYSTAGLIVVRGVSGVVCVRDAGIGGGGVGESF